MNSVPEREASAVSRREFLRDIGVSTTLFAAYIAGCVKVILKTHDFIEKRWVQKAPTEERKTAAKVLQKVSDLGLIMQSLIGALLLKGGIEYVASADRKQLQVEPSETTATDTP